MIKKDEARHAHHPLPKFTIGQRVWLYCNYSKKGLSKKLLRKWHGPYVITSQTGKVVALKSEEGLHMAHRINIERVRAVVHSQFRPTADPALKEDTEWEGGDLEFPPSSYELDTDRAYVEPNRQMEVEAIRGWRRHPNKTRGKKGVLEYLVRWTGLGAEYDEWLTTSNMDCGDLLAAYKRKEKKRGRPVGKTED